MELPFKVIVIAAVLVMVLLFFSLLIASNVPVQMSRADANKIFYTTCTKYKSAGCGWSLTKEASFPDFLKACKTLFGNANEFACLYSLCNDCKEYELSNLACAAQCKICNGNDYAGVQSSCCSRFRSECSGYCRTC